MNKMKKKIKTFLITNPDISEIIHKCSKCKREPHESYSINGKPSCEWCKSLLEIYAIDKKENKIPDKIRVIKVKDLNMISGKQQTHLKIMKGGKE